MVIPRKGDIWEYKLPNKPKKCKEIGNIRMVQMETKNGNLVFRPYIEWVRLPKGRYSGIRAKWLLKYGTRVSTKKERDEEFKLLIQKRKNEVK
jgi:hypothetical protein